jgi:hypothetical protein
MARASSARAELWLLTSGSYSVHLTVSGPAGEGTVIVPLVSMSTRRLAMSTGLGGILTALGVVLVASAVVLVSSGARESVLAPGLEPTAQAVRRGRLGPWWRSS